MNKCMQIYYNAVFGGLGGLVAWWSIGSLNAGSWNIWLASAVIGAAIGASISAFVAAMEGAMVKRSLQRALFDGLKGALAGLIGGLLGLLLGQISFLFFGGGFIGRTLGWMVLGLLVGWGELSVSGKPQRASYAAIGGLVGGLVGGLAYEGLTQLFITYSNEVQVWLGGIGIMLIGACIGALIAFTRHILSRGELRVLNGERAGTIREITDTISIGSYDGCDIYLPDPTVARRHAIVGRRDSDFVISLFHEVPPGAHVASQPLALGQERALQPNDVIQIGNTRLQFMVR